MTHINDILKIIEEAKARRGPFNNSEILSILNATKGLNTNGAFLDNNLVSKLKKLTTREVEVFSLVGNGKSTKDIANALGLRVSTIETHRKNIRRKLGLKGKGKLFEFALLTTLITHQEP